MTMSVIVDRRAIVDRRILSEAVNDIYAREHVDTARRAAVLALLREALEVGRSEVRSRFESGTADSLATVHANAFLVDQILRVTYDVAEREYPTTTPTKGDRLVMIAVGGYGRAEMAPASDVDLLFLYPYKQTPRGEQTVEFVLYMLWDLKLKIGHATRSTEECLRLARQDWTIATAVLEARYLWGDQELFNDLRHRFTEDVVAGTKLRFVEAKLAERDARHKRMGDSRYVLEPNIKEGKGGLRDLQTLFWIGKYVYGANDATDLVQRGILSTDEARRFDKAHTLLLAIRCHLHYLTGRGEERLTFDLQPEIARLLGYTDHPGVSGVERFMKHYYIAAKEVGNLTRIYCAAIEAKHKRRPWLRLPRLAHRQDLRGFRQDGDWLTVAHDEVFAKDPVALMRLFHVSHVTGLDIHPHALRLVTQSLRTIDAEVREDPEANRLFVDILSSKTDPTPTLRRMNEAALFGRFFPDFGRVVGQMQHDMYHVYTVDEHTIFALGILNGIERGIYPDDHPLCTRVIHEIQSRRALYIGLLLHDIAKGRGGDHSVLGAEVAETVCPRLGLTPEETETVAWLVRQHLVMSNTAFRRDLSDPKTIADFIEIVQSPERLKLLACLTVADIRAVGPGVWNNWKGALLRELYDNAYAAMTISDVTAGRDHRIAAAKEDLVAALDGWPKDAVDDHLRRGYPSYWLAFDTDTLAHQARLVRKAEARESPLGVATRVDSFRAVTEVTVYAPDGAGVFASITGAMAVAGATIVDARIFTTPQGMALDAFWVQDVEGNAFAGRAPLARLANQVERAVRGQLRPAEVAKATHFVPQRTAVFHVSPRVIIDNTASATHTVIEVNGRDRPGFLFTTASAIFELGLRVASAKISTYGERAVDTFYVKDAFGMKVTHQSKLNRIREVLEAAVAEPDTAPDTDTPAEPKPEPAAAQ